MRPSIRKFALTAHITSSVGWLGAVASFLVLAVAGLLSSDAQTVRATYLAMELTTWYIIVPLAMASLLTGLVQSLGTPWGLFRHYWIIAKFMITIVATSLLLVHTRPIGILAGAAKEVTTAVSNYRGLQVQLVGDAIAAIVLLLMATILSVYKPWGMTVYGRRKQAERQKSQSDVTDKSDKEIGITPAWQPTIRRPRWVYVVGIHAIGLALLFIVFHLTGRGLPGH